MPKKPKAGPTKAPLFKAVLQPIQNFFKLEASSGILLLASALFALAWANSPFAASYFGLFHLPLSVAVGKSTFAFDVHAVINDGLMALFFFVVGMEIKRELVMGELRTPSKAMLPAIAAVGGMLVPAGIYLIFNAGKPTSSGWAIPMATDIAFSIGLLTALKGRVSHALVVFLTALAIFDDMGGILVIALFYGGGINGSWLFAAAVLTAGLFLWNKLYIRNGVLWLIGGVLLWLCLHEGGIHATIAGVILGFCIPAQPRREPKDILAELHQHTKALSSADRNQQAEEILHIEEALEDVEAPLNRFVHLLHPYVAFGIVPLFALANSGVSLKGAQFSTLGAAVPLGILLGLLVGKPIGIFVFTWVAVRMKLSAMPGNATLTQLFGIGAVGGIGFTVALFVATLAFTNDGKTLDAAKLGILLGSVLAASFGYLLLRFGPMPAKLPGSTGRETVKSP